MRLLGLDWGEARIGVAVSDPLGITAQPVRSIGNDADLIDKLKEIISEYAAGEIVLGLPNQMNGSPGVAAAKVIGFSEKLRSSIPLKITLWDERMTTKIAHSYFEASGASRKKRKEFIDAAAACIILQSYIDSRGA